jgi:hypothetical protein
MSNSPTKIYHQGVELRGVNEKSNLIQPDLFFHSTYTKLDPVWPAKRHNRS